MQLLIQNQRASRPSAILSAVAVVAAAVGVTGVALVAILRPGPVGAAFVVVALGLLILWRPTKLGFPLAVALLYSNVAVVAVRYWGLPGVFPLVVLAVMVPALAIKVLLRERPLKLDRGFFLLTCFVGANVVSAVFAQFPGPAQDAMFQLLTEGLLVYFLVTNLATSRSVLIAVMWAIVLAAAFGAGLALLQQLTSDQLVDFGGLAVRVPDYPSPNAPLRAQGPLGEANFFAQTLVMAIPFAAGLVALGQRRRTKAAALVALVLTLTGIALTGSRGGAVAAGAVLILLPLIPGIHFKRLAISGVVLVGVLLVTVPGFVDRLSSLQQVGDVATGSATVDVSIQGRLVENLVAVQMFIDHPLVGVGPGGYPSLYRSYAAAYLGFQSRGARPPHSLPLQLLAETGILGLITFASVMAYLLFSLWQARRFAQRPDAVLASACFVALCGYLVSGLFLHPAYLRFLWLVLGVTGGAIAIARSSTRPTVGQVVGYVGAADDGSPENSHVAPTVPSR